ncbi:hypothetical protein [Vibrio alginolyticus]|uniref:hypothetical protein n=1 Tax=Vibrio TaxID=662 RepID=UPI0006CAA04C|nr:hypothetical protein [Vibrio alginolyticus]KPM97587.1 hypothetical protein AOG25_14050 [Vibrio alginolyticus]CAH7368137.1 conserved hypothetical protein [Vibrio chagasii]
MHNNNAHTGTDLGLFRTIFQTPGYGEMQKVQDSYFEMLDLGKTKVTSIYLNCDSIHLNIGEYVKNSMTEHHAEFVVIDYQGKAQGYQGDGIRDSYQDIAAWITPQLNLLAHATSKMIRLSEQAQSKI